MCWDVVAYWVICQRWWADLGGLGRMRDVWLKGDTLLQRLTYEARRGVLDMHRTSVWFACCDCAEGMSGEEQFTYGAALTDATCEETQKN